MQGGYRACGGKGGVERKGDGGGEKETEGDLTT